MAIEDVLTRISAIQARFGVGGGVIGSSEFDGLLSDAARHAGITPNDRLDGSATTEIATAGAATGATVSGTAARETPTSESTTAGSETPGSATPGSTTDGSATPAAASDGPAEQGDAVGTTEPATSDVVAVLDELGVPTDGPSGEALEALSVAAAPALTTAVALGRTDSSSLLETLGAQVGAEEGTAMLASIIAQQQAGAGIIRATGS